MTDHVAKSVLIVLRRRFGFTCSHAGQVAGEAVGGGNEKVSGAAGGVTDSHSENGVFCVVTVPTNPRFSLVAYWESNFLSAKGKRFALQICGSEGIVEIVTGYLPAANFLADPMWSPGRSGAQWVPISSAGVGKPEPLPNDHHMGNVLACRDLIAAIEEDRLPECSVYEGRTTVEMIAAVFESHRLGGPAAMPLKNRKNPLAML